MKRFSQRTLRLASLRRSLTSWTCVETPNPKVRKFELLLEKSPSASLGSVASSSARQQLLGLVGVRDVFLGGGLTQDRRDTVHEGSPDIWISVTRDDAANWEALAPRVQQLLEDLPQAGSEAEVQSEAAQEPLPVAREGIEADIVEILDARIRPGVQADGGDVQLVRWDPASGEVTLQLQGACQGCPHSSATLRDTIQRALTHFIPEVKSVVAELAVEANGEDPNADIPLDHTPEPAAEEIAGCSRRGTPFFSTFAGMRMEGPRLRRVKFLSRLALEGRTPEHVFVTCVSCNAKRTIEDPSDLLREDKGNTTGDAAVVICPACCVLITR